MYLSIYVLIYALMRGMQSISVYHKKNNCIVYVCYLRNHLKTIDQIILGRLR